MPLLLDTFLWSNILLPLIPFALGVILTVAITSVNHKRIHRDDIRKTIFDAVLDIKNCASEYWLSEYDEKKRSNLVGSAIFLYRIMPLSKNMMNKKQLLEMESILGKLVVALMGKEEMNQECHAIDSKRISEIHTIIGSFLERYYSFYFKQTKIRTLTICPYWIQIGNLYPLWLWIKDKLEIKNGGA